MPNKSISLSGEVHISTEQVYTTVDALEALKAIRAKDNKANVLWCYAMGQEAMVVEAVQAGIKDFIVKPFKEDRLMKTVNSILGAP